MPSYIELDKNPTIPSATAEGKVILGVTTQGNLTITNNTGNILPVGGGMVTITREEIQTLVESGSLTPGTYYKITNAASQSFLDNNGFSWSGYGNEIQIGGTTIILQATSEKTLSKEGVGLFYVPNYENPNVPTVAPDYNYLTWDNTHRLYFINLNGRLPIGAGVTLYSNETTTSTNATLEGGLEGEASGYVTLRLNSHNDTFFQNPDNLIGLEIQYGGGISGSIDGLDYISSYTPGDCVIFGGRVWQNLSGSIGWREGGGQWPTNVLNLNPEDWEVVPFDEVSYTLQSHTIEYDFEHDNISYRSDGKNEVRCDWSWWDDNYGYNTIGYFPWGHYGVERVSFTNTYLHHFVNFPWQCEARDIKFEHDSVFNATTWGKESYFNRIYGAASANFGGNNFSRNTDIWDITIGIDADFRNIRTSNAAQIYEVTIGSNAGFNGVDMYNGSEIYRIEIGTQAYFGDSTHYEWTNVYGVELGIDADLYSFTLETYSEIKDITIGVNSYIRNFDLAYSSCLKRTTIASDGYISIFDIGVDSFIRQVNLSDRAYITDFTIGDYSNLQNIDLGAYAYMNDFNGGYSTNFENIRLDASSHISSVHAGQDGALSQIQIAPGSSLYNVNTGNSVLTGSCVTGINIQTFARINNIQLGNGSYFGDIYVGDDGYIDNVTLEGNAQMYDMNFMGATTATNILICTGSEVHNFQIGVGAGFGYINVTSSANLDGFELGQGTGFSSTTISSSASDVTISRGFNNYEATTYMVGTTGSLVWADRDSMTRLEPNKSFHIIDTTGWDADTTDLNYYLPNGNWEGQRIELIIKSGGTNLSTNAGRIHIWLQSLRDPTQQGAIGTEYPWYAFYHPTNNYQSWRYDNPKATWIDGAWTIDNFSWD
jgi:hypothetical protein